MRKIQTKWRERASSQLQKTKLRRDGPLRRTVAGRVHWLRPFCKQTQRGKGGQEMGRGVHSPVLGQQHHLSEQGLRMGSTNQRSQGYELGQAPNTKDRGCESQSERLRAPAWAAKWTGQTDTGLYSALSSLAVCDLCMLPKTSICKMPQ